MPRTRLYRSIVVFGTSIGAGTALGGAFSALVPGCDLYYTTAGSNDHRWPIIDASFASIHDGPCPDAWCVDAGFGMIDAASDGGWGTIADAPNPDAKGHT
ncbi:MAG TPA: hypothetical protein VLX92_25805 [Kofleriaceae bacterium]|nr:hypothetical protein [Kofleriaceae bacterium]